ncbi:sulfatase-like hydrolase/transferase [Arthrobacter sp. HY1533]|uniref:sulfatase-like hydrolase/transferase n=1 Tax=Arthrobacter sp. HY1533 TaxID=2970919 RepID=UPI0022BA00C2|nr:sulfatase-like hydrolase/transferase [Arthrobacter sp. HY1533]
MKLSTVPDRREQWLRQEQPFKASKRDRPAQPNVIFIFADDLGWGDLGCYGSLHNDTPVLDQLAADGVRFTDAYAASPTCSPTRVALYTGRYPGRLPVGLEEPLLSRDAEHGIPAQHPTLPSMLKDTGYQTAMFGKWHCGWLPWFSPLDIGFERFFGNMDGVLDYYGHVDSKGMPDLYEGKEPVEVVGYYTDILSDKSVDYIRTRDTSKPFYLQLNYTAPHFPWEAPGDEAVSEKVLAAIDTKGARGMFHFEGGSRDTYRRMIKAMDDGIGRVLEAVDDEGIRDNTIIIFASDNGGERYAFLWPFVGEKGDLEEGGIRVPFLVRWPAALDAGQVSGTPVVTMDWTATILDAAGTAPHPDKPLDGQSLLGWLVDGNSEPEDALLWRTRGQGAVRKGRFKLLHDRVAKPLWHKDDDFAGSRTRLFDLGTDDREKADVAEMHPEVVQELLGLWRTLDAELMHYPEHEEVELEQGNGLAD